MIRMANLWLIARNTDVYISSKKVYVSRPMVEISSFAIQGLLCQIVAKFAKFAKSIGGRPDPAFHPVSPFQIPLRFPACWETRCNLSLPASYDRRPSLVSRVKIIDSRTHRRHDRELCQELQYTIGISQISVTNTYWAYSARRTYKEEYTSRWTSRRK